MSSSLDSTHYQQIAEMLDALPERVIRYRMIDLCVVYCNEAWAAGHDVQPAEVIGRSLDGLLCPAELVGLRAQLALLGPLNPRLADNVPRAAPNAPGQWVEWVDQYLPGPDGPEVLAVGRDVTGRHIAELNLADSEARFRDLADKSADVVWRFVIEPSPHFDYISPSVEKILGYPPAVFLDDFTNFLDILDDDGRALVAGALSGIPMPERGDLRHRCADGSIVIGEMQTSIVPGGIQGVSRNVTELRRLQADLASLALHDPLTGLANRRLMTELLDAALVRADRNGRPVSVAFLDLDNFKYVNDAFGHDAGDAVLCETARRLLSTVRTSDTVARLGGDEFVLVLESTTDDDMRSLIARLDAVLAAPISVASGVTVRCPASIGTASSVQVGLDQNALLAAADAAMYEAKRMRATTV